MPTTVAANITSIKSIKADMRWGLPGVKWSLLNSSKYHHFTSGRAFRAFHSTWMWGIFCCAKDEPRWTCSKNAFHPHSKSVLSWLSKPLTIRIVARSNLSSCFMRFRSGKVAVGQNPYLCILGPRFGGHLRSEQLHSLGSPPTFAKKRYFGLLI